MRKTLLATAVATLALGGVAVAAPASAAPSTGVASARHAPCGTAAKNIENRVEADAPAGDAVNQRSGSSTGCAAVGVLQPTDDARYFCFTVGNDGFRWTYLENLRTSVRGWSRSDLLDNNGSARFCGR